MILLTLTLCCLLVTASPLANSILPLRPSISSIDHINLNIPSHSPFLEFYHALGLHPDPHRFRNLALNNKVVNKATNEVIFKGGKGTVWMNAGSSQIHLPAGKTAQKIDGKIGLDYASPEEVLRVVRRLSLNKIGGTIKIQDGGKIVECECPGGNSFVLYGGGGAHLHPHPRHPIVVDDPLNAFAYENSNPNQNSSEEDSEDSEDSDFVFCLGVRYVEFNVKFGLAERIAKFYDEVFGCEAGVVVDEKTTKSENKVKVAVVNVDSGQSMLFRELKAGVEPLEYDGHHVSVFVGNSFEDFNAVYNTAEARGLVWINERFSDKADTLEKASEANQFRMRDFKDEEGAFFRLEHEVRCVDHEMFPASRILEEEEVGEL